MTSARWLVLLAALAWIPGRAGAAEPDPQLEGFGEVIDVRVVNAEVVVTNEKGERIPGLGKGDFRILVDGRELPITHFSEVRDGVAVAAAGESAPAPAPGVEAGARVGTSYLVFIDDLFSLRVRRDEVLKALKAEVAHFAPEDRMAIVAFDGRQLTRLSPWSSSVADLAAALDRALARRAHGIVRKAELASLASANRFMTIGDRSGLNFDQLAYARQLNDRIERAVQAAVTTLRSFGTAPGRKVMLVLAGGWPYSTSQYAANTITPFHDPRLPWSGKAFTLLADTANRLGYTLYPIDVPGFEGDEGMDASLARPITGGWNVRENEVHSALTYLAAKTGGLAMINAGRMKALSNARADTRSYYWLGFTPSWRQDDRRHQVDVKVTRPGLSARARRDVLDLSRQTEVALTVENALLFGAAGMPTMAMALGKPERTAAKEMEMPVTLTIPLSAVTVVRMDGKHKAMLTLRFAALDERGDRSEIPAIPLRWSFDGPPPADGSGTIRYDTKLKLRRIDQKILVALFDPFSGKITTAEAEVKKP